MSEQRKRDKWETEGLLLTFFKYDSTQLATGTNHSQRNNGDSGIETSQT